MFSKRITTQIIYKTRLVFVVNYKLENEKSLSTQVEDQQKENGIQSQLFGN